MEEEILHIKYSKIYIKKERETVKLQGGLKYQK